MRLLLHSAVVIFGILLSKKRMVVGDHDGALRRARWTSLGVPNIMSLHNEGLVRSLAGRSGEAEPCYRAALTMAGGSAY